MVHNLLTSIKIKEILNELKFSFFLYFCYFLKNEYLNNLYSIVHMIITVLAMYIIVLIAVIYFIRL